MLGELAKEDELDRSLDLSEGDGRLFVLASEARILLGELFKYIIDEGVYNAYSLVGDPDGKALGLF